MTESNDQIQAQDIPGAADVPAAAEGQGERRGAGRGGERGGERRGRGGGRGDRRNQERDSEWQERVVQGRPLTAVDFCMTLAALRELKAHGRVLTPDELKPPHSGPRGWPEIE